MYTYIFEHKTSIKHYVNTLVFIKKQASRLFQISKCLFNRPNSNCLFGGDVRGIGAIISLFFFSPQIVFIKSAPVFFCAVFAES